MMIAHDEPPKDHTKAPRPSQCRSPVRSARFALCLLFAGLGGAPSVAAVRGVQSTPAERLPSDDAPRLPAPATSRRLAA